MRRRGVLWLGAALVVAFTLSVGSAAAGGPNTLDVDAAPWGGTQNTANWNGSAWTYPGPWNDPESCIVQFPGTTDETSVQEYRTVFEFNLSGLPAGVSIVGAELELTDTVGASGGPVEVLGYPGNGTVESADFAISGVPIVINPTSTSAETYDLTALMSPTMQAAGWAGILLQPAIDRSSQANPQISHWFTPVDCPATLSIEYALPATPTPQASLQNSAAAPPSLAQPLATLGFGLLMVAGLGALAVASVRSRR